LPKQCKETEFEPLDCVSNANKAWSESVKQKYNTIVRTMRKPFVKSKKNKTGPPPTESTGGEPGLEKPTGGFPDIDPIYDSNTLYEALLRVNSSNYGGNMMLTWGPIKV
jgi:hypothetical protein